MTLKNTNNFACHPDVARDVEFKLQKEYKIYW